MDELEAELLADLASVVLDPDDLESEDEAAPLPAVTSLPPVEQLIPTIGRCPCSEHEPGKRSKHRICSVASRPFMPGMLTSMRTTS